MRLTDAAEPMFARHETFHPRYGWFRKAFEAALYDHHAFTNDDATIEMGVGKNMVRAIRFWGLAAGVVQVEPEPANPRSPGVVPTEFGQMLFGDEGSAGWDPFMEDPGTMWLLHWKLLSPRCLLPVWWVAFNELAAVEFEASDLESACAAEIDAASEWAVPHPSSIRKDVTALLRTYAPAERTARTSIDDLLDCPLRELGLITKSAATGKYRFAIGPKPTLPPAVVAHAVLDHASRTDLQSRTALLSRMADEPGSPGRAFRLTETELADALRSAVAESEGDLTLASPAGSPQLAWSKNTRSLSIEVLNRYFGPGSNGPGWEQADDEHEAVAMSRLPVGLGVT